MRLLRKFLPVLALASLALPSLAQASPPAGPALLPYETMPPAATHPSLYSFADAYRLALAGEPFAELRDERHDSLPIPEPEAHMRIVSRTNAGTAPEPRFSVSAPRDAGGRWPLILAGLFACAWVAHRRLTSPY